MSWLNAKCKGVLWNAPVQVASEWGCRSVMLHCDPGNTAAYNLYRTHGYGPACDAPKWQPLLEVSIPPLAELYDRP